MDIEFVFLDFGGVITSNRWGAKDYALIARDSLLSAGYKLEKNFIDVFIEIYRRHRRVSLRTLRELNIRKVLEDVLGRFSIDYNAIDVIINRYKKGEFCKINVGIDKVLEGIRRLGIGLAIVSNAILRYHDYVLENYGILKFFETIVLSCEVGYRKPDTRIYLEALKRLNVDPRKSIYVGDIPEIDVPGAKKLGMITIIIRHEEPYTYADLMPISTADITPDYYVDTVHELVDTITMIKNT